MSEANVSPLQPTEVVGAFADAAITALQEMTQLDTFPEPTPPADQRFPPEDIVLAAIRLLRAAQER